MYHYRLIEIGLVSHFVVFSIVEDKTGALGEKDRILQEKEAELKRMQEMLAQMKAKMEKQQS